MRKELMIKYFSLLEKRVPPAQIEAFIKKSGIDVDKVLKIAEIIIAVNSTFSQSFLIAQQKGRALTAEEFVTLMSKNLASLNIDIETVPKELLFGVIEAIIAISNQLMSEMSSQEEG